LTSDDKAFDLLESSSLLSSSFWPARLERRKNINKLSECERGFNLQTAQSLARRALYFSIVVLDMYRDEREEIFYDFNRIK
jgi:hypothetical protein